MCIPTWNIFFQIALSLDQLYMKKRRVIKFPSKIYFDWFVFIDIHDVRTWNKNFFFFFQFALLSHAAAMFEEVSFSKAPDILE